MHAKKLLSLALSALAAVTLLASCGSRWDYSREAVKAANEAQGENLRVEFQIDQKLTNALHAAVEDNIQPADVEKAMLADASLKELLTSGYRLNIYAEKADVKAEDAAQKIAEDHILSLLSGCKDEGCISMVKAENNYFYEAVLTYKEGSSGGGGGHEPGEPDDKPEKPVIQYSVIVVTKPEDEDLGTVTPSAAKVEEGGDITFTVQPNDGVNVTDITVTVNSGSIKYEYDAENSTYAINDIKSDVTITVTFEVAGPPPFPVQWEQTTKTLTFQMGEDSTGTKMNAATAMGNTSILTEESAKKGLQIQADWLLENDPENYFDPAEFNFQLIEHLVITGDSGVTEIADHQPEFYIDSQPQLSVKPYLFLGSTLSTVSMSGVKKIGNYTFWGCVFLTNFEANGVTDIGDSAFYGCGQQSGNTIINIASTGDLTVGEEAFCFAQGLKEVNLTAKTISIGADAFNNSYSLNSLTLNGEVTSVGKNALSGPGSRSILTIYYDLGEEAFAKVCPNEQISNSGLEEGDYIFKTIS